MCIGCCWRVAGDNDAPTGLEGGKWTPEVFRRGVRAVPRRARPWAVAGRAVDVAAWRLTQVAGVALG
jgi:hypothetical protein